MSAPRRGWRYFATRLNGDGTETLLSTDLPLEDVTIEEVLSGDNALSGKIDPMYKRFLDSDKKPILRPMSTAIYAECDGVIRSGGILSRSGFEGSSWALEASGFTSYGREMPYTGEGAFFVQADPLFLGRMIWAHIQAQAGGNIGLTFAPTTTNGAKLIGTELKQVEFDTVSGPVSFESGPYKLNWYTNHDLQGDFDALAAEAPFDYIESHSWNDDGTIKHYVDMGYPSIGTMRRDLRFTFGENIFDAPSVEQDGMEYASGSMVLGAGEGATMVRSILEPVRKPGDPLRRIAVVVDSTIKSRARADSRAKAEVQWRSRLDDISSFTVIDHPHAPLGAARVGDIVRLEGKPGDGNWVGADLWVRILSIAYQPANGKIAEYTVTRTDKLVS